MGNVDIELRLLVKLFVLYYGFFFKLRKLGGWMVIKLFFSVVLNF